MATEQAKAKEPVLAMVQEQERVTAMARAE